MGRPQFEGGGHRVQRVPETEAQGRIHTSAATVAVLPEPKEIDIQINPNDVVEHVSARAAPAVRTSQGQFRHPSRNTSPTGITVNMREDKASDKKSRKKAWRILRSRLYEHFHSRKRAKARPAAENHDWFR